jgi:hypothetical protein
MKAMGRRIRVQMIPGSVSFWWLEAMTSGPSIGMFSTPWDSRRAYRGSRKYFVTRVAVL